MSTLALTDGNDLAIENGGLVIVTDFDQVTSIQTETSLRHWLDTWFLDTSIGFPYREIVFVKDPDLDVIGQAFRNAISQVEGVAQVDELQVDFISNTRELDMTFRATLKSGSVLTGGTGAPFVVTPKTSEVE